MKKGFKYLIATLFFCVFYFFSCSTTNTQMDSDNYIDSLLIGEWYLVETMDSVYPSPKFHFYGIQINEDRSMISLGIETNTGKVEISDNPSIDTIIYAYDETIHLKKCSGSVVGEFDMNYVIKENKLTIGEKPNSRTYSRTSLHAPIFTPVISDVSVKVDSVLMTNQKVREIPSAFITQKGKSYVIFGATFSSTRIEIVIDNFNGVGIYNIPYNKGRFSIFFSDVILGGSSDTTTTATFIVDKYDEVNNTCSGRFSFDAYSSIKKQILKYEIREGVFTVPIYR